MSMADYWRNSARNFACWRGSSWRNRIPQAIVELEAEGFAWGGRWFHYDTMHFRMACFDARCRGIAAEPMI